MLSNRTVQRWVAAVTHLPGAPTLAASTLWATAHMPRLWRSIPPIYREEIAHPTPMAILPQSATILSRTVEHDGRIECWAVASTAMGRIVHVQIKRPSTTKTPAPLLFLFDGVTAPRNSGWLREGHLLEIMADQHVTVVMPTEASGSLYLDWPATDAVLGHCQWETFLIKELLPLLRQEQESINPITELYTAGLSMGAGAAVRIASRHPDLFHGTIGLSGWYHTTSRWGRIMTVAAIRCVDGDPETLYGPGIGTLRESRRVRFATLKHYDVNPEGLRAMPTYLATFNGKVSRRDLKIHATRPAWELPGASLLELLALKETKTLARKLRRLRATPVVVSYRGNGVHDWAYYPELLLAGWEFVRARRESVVPPGNECPTGVDLPNSRPEAEPTG